MSETAFDLATNMLVGDSDPLLNAPDNTVDPVVDAEPVVDTEDALTPDGESFTKIDPNTLDPVLAQVYKSMQADYTRKAQEIAGYRKLGADPDTLQRAYEFFNKMDTDPNYAKAVAEHVMNTLGGNQPVQDEDASDDFEFDKMLQMVSSFIIARHGIDPAQLGLRLNQSQALAEPSMDGRQNFARDRSHGSLMSFHEDCLNEVIDASDESEFRLSFIGVKSEELDKKASLEDKQFKVSRSMDEIRKSNDLITLKEEADEYVKQGIITPEQGKKFARLGLLRGNQYFSQEFSKIFADDPAQGGGAPGQIPGQVENPEAPSDTPLWDEEDFLPSDQQPTQ